MFALIKLLYTYSCISIWILYFCVCMTIRKDTDYMKLAMNENRSVNACEHLVYFFFFQWMSHGLGRVLPTTTQNSIRVSRGSGQGITNRARTHSTCDDGDRLKVSNKRYPFLSNLQPHLTVYACGFFRFIGVQISWISYHY